MSKICQGCHALYEGEECPHYKRPDIGRLVTVAHSELAWCEKQVEWPVVLAFAQEMQRKLAQRRRNGSPLLPPDQPGWRLDPINTLFGRLRDEVNELREALVNAKNQAAYSVAIKGECLDVAAFAMMIFDVVDVLQASVDMEEPK